MHVPVGGSALATNCTGQRITDDEKNRQMSADFTSEDGAGQNDQMYKNYAASCEVRVLLLRFKGASRLKGHVCVNRELSTVKIKFFLVLRATINRGSNTVLKLELRRMETKRCCGGPRLD